MLATFLTFFQAVLWQPNDVQDFGRWVSGLFHCIQHPHNQQVREKQSVSSTISEGNSSEWDTDMKGEEGLDVVSVKEMRAIFESGIETASPSSVYSSPSPSLVGQSFDFRSQLVTTPTEQTVGRNIGSPDFLESNYEKVKAKLQSKYADVVCWMGPYMEQEEEKQVLSSMANPFLAKLRLRHKLEMVAQLEEAISGIEGKIRAMKEKLEEKELTKREITTKRQNTGLIRSAEDAKRAGNENKRMDKECAVLQSKINQEESQLEQLKIAAYELQQEIEMAYEQFSWESSNGKNNEQNSNGKHGSEPDRSIAKLKMPDWTKNAKQKAHAWQILQNNAK